MGSLILRLGILMVVLTVTVKSDDYYDLDVENTLKTLLTPQEYPTIQLQALRRNILRRLLNRIDNDNNDDIDNNLFDKWNKRNLEALARAGLVRTLPLSTEDDNDNNNDHVNNNDDDSNIKRSLSNLVKNGQLPITYQNKRGIQSLARNGELKQHHTNLDNNVDDIINDFYGNKRNIGSLARTGNLHFGKRNIASIARDGIKINGQRFNDKRNLPSIKAQFSTNRKFKRDLNRQLNDYYQNDNDEYPSPVYQNQNIYDYEELMKALTGVYPNTEKRFLGRLPQMGKPKTTPPPKTRYH